ncbi:MAG: hypothetical protein ACREXK_01690 [Gammaproteobacteria bacterium]
MEKIMAKTAASAKKPAKPAAKTAKPAGRAAPKTAAKRKTK